MDASQTHPVDQVLGPHRLVPLGLQHVLVMYAGAVAVPLIVGGALKLAPEQIAFLVSADLFCCGLATMIQSIGFPFVGIRLPVMMGVTFASVAPMLAMAANPAIGLTGIYGAVIAAGIFGLLISPFIGALLPLFPPVVTGSIITVIGVTLMPIGINWAGGAAVPTAPGYGDPINLEIAGAVLLLILLITRLTRGFIANIAVLIGLVAGCGLAFYLGKMNFDKVASAPWFALITPFSFGLPTFDVTACITMALVMIVVFIESTGMFLALSQMVEKPITSTDLGRGLRADALGTVLGGVFNTFPYTSFSQNVGLVGVTGVRSRWVTATAGGMLVALGLCPKMGALVAAVPLAVLGGAGLVMFGMVAATGIRILSDVDFKTTRNNLYVVALSIGFGLIPLASNRQLFAKLPGDLKPLLESGILLASISAVLLNLFFNGLSTRADAKAAAARTTHGAEA